MQIVFKVCLETHQMDNLTCRTADFGAQVSPISHRQIHHDQVRDLRQWRHTLMIRQHFTSTFFVQKCFVQLLCAYSLGL